MRILGVRDLGLASEPQPLHGDPVRGVDVGPDHERTMIGQDFVGAQNVGRGADLTAAEAIFGHAEETGANAPSSARSFPRERRPGCESRIAP